MKSFSSSSRAHHLPIPRPRSGPPRFSIPQTGRGLLLFLWLRRCTMRAAWQTLRHEPLKLVVIVATWGTLLLGAYGLAYEGLRFLYVRAGIGPFLLDRLWYLLLLIVSVMLLVSHVATAYVTMIRASETAWWLGLPLSARWILRAKWLESSTYSAWAVLLLLLPLGLAYLVVLRKPVWLLGWMVGTVLPLVGIATAWATLVLLAWLRWVRIRVSVRRELVPLGFVVIWVVVFWLLGQQESARQEDVWFVALQELLPRMQMATSMWVPSSWAARALSAGLNQRWMEAWLFAGLLWTTALVSVRVLDHVAAAVLLPVLRRSPHLSSARTAERSSAPPMQVGRWWTRRPFAACLVKDVALLLRDPTQWGQGVVFFGLLGAYFANIHRIAQLSVEPAWRIGVASLNLSCTLLVFGSLTVRFLFPQMSLEGRRLWLLHIVPGGLRWLFYSKLVFYGVLGVGIIEALLGLSVARLQVPTPIGWWLAAVGVIASLSLVGLSLGLGAQFLDPRLSDPARFVSSSNGALALVLMLVYVGAVAWTLVLCWTGWLQGDRWVWMLVASASLLVISALFGVLPVIRGLRALAHFEY